MFKRVWKTRRRIMNKLSVIIALHAICVVRASADCGARPANIDVANCCKFPDMQHDEVVAKVVDSFKHQNFPGFITECKIAEGIMKELKLVKGDGFDKDAVLKHLETKATEAYWKGPAKAVGEQCLKEIETKKDEIIKELGRAPFNITKDHCNPAYAYMTICVGFEAFKRCPKEAWTNEKRCDEAKSYLEKCDDKLGILFKA